MNAVSVCRIAGELTDVGVPKVRLEIEELIDAGCVRLAVNVGKLSFISSGGLGFLVSMRHRVREQGGDLVFAGRSAFLEKMLATLGYDRFLPVFPDDDTARAFLSAS